jgi:hypothetical protein
VVSGTPDSRRGSLTEERDVITIFDRPGGLRFIGVTQMAFGAFGLLASIGILVATLTGAALLQPIGYLYAALVFLGVALPCLVIGNYVDDLRRSAVIAQVFYSLFAVGLAGYLLYARGLSYNWAVPLFGLSIDISIGNVAAFIVFTQTIFLLYLLVRWKKVVPPPGARVVRDRGEAKRVEMGLMPTPLTPALLAPDGESMLSSDKAREVMDVRRVVTKEGMAILCSNCGGANPLTDVKDDNTLVCEYCGVHLGVSSVFVPCENHPEYLAATTCAVCGEHFCRQCLTAQAPPVDERWSASTIFLCRKCFEGRYRPAVTTTSLVIPIEGLFSTAGGRFSRVGGVYKQFLGAYGSGMKHIWRLPLELLASVGRSGGGGGSNDCAGALILIVIIIIAIPVLIGLLLLAGAIVLIPLLFYIGLVGVIAEAVKIISKTDFQSLNESRIDSVVERKEAKMKESTLRPTARPWQAQSRVNVYEQEQMRKRELEQRRSEARRFWGT